ncbi:MAG: substrate-binding domain-containing protein [Thermodesulfovibrionales bacterium]
MKIKKLFTMVISSAFLFAIAGVASATVSGDINIYGSSAQFNFWKAEAPKFFSAQGCTGITSSTYDSKDVITQATCGGSPRNFRVTSKASWDGVLAIEGNDTNVNLSVAGGPYGSGNVQCGGGGLNGGCANYNQRCMIDETTCSGGSCSGLKCVTVTAGASDVQVNSFTQQTYGQLKGNNNGGYIHRNFTGANGITLTPGTAEACRELVVPFAFWVHNDVKFSNGSLVNNLTTAQIKLIFSGQIEDWSDMAGFTAEPIQVCWRHAGSGTLATLQYAVMGSAVLQETEDLTGPYHYYFNDGTSDEMNCVNQLSGAVGFADADVNYPTAAYASVNPVSVNGFAATAKNIAEGSYDYWSIENLYTVSPVPSDEANLCAYLAVPANVANADPFYAATCQMAFTRTSDQAYLTYYGSPCGGL